MMLATGHDSGATSTWRPSLCILPPPPDLCPPSSAPSPDLISQPLSSLDLPVSDSFCPLEADKWWALESALSFYTKTDITFPKHLFLKKKKKLPCSEVRFCRDILLYNRLLQKSEQLNEEKTEDLQAVWEEKEAFTQVIPNSTLKPLFSHSSFHIINVAQCGWPHRFVFSEKI